MKRVKGVAALIAIAVGLAAIIPFLAHAVFAFFGWIFSMIGAGFTLLAAWFAKASDEPHEKAIWGGILLFLTAAMIYYLGLPLLQYWWLLAIVAAVFGIAVLNIKWKERRKEKRRKRG
jgi:membrane protein DedA with SNARE-associated domain